jgi:hypothetical protein
MAMGDEGLIHALACAGSCLLSISTQAHVCCLMSWGKATVTGGRRIMLH